MAPRASTSTDTLDMAEKTIRLLQRNRRARHTKAKETSRAILDDLDNASRPAASDEPGGSQSTCPICQQTIAGEPLAEHVDRCLQETIAREEHAGGHQDMETYEFGGEARVRSTVQNGYAGMLLSNSCINELGY